MSGLLAGAAEVAGGGGVGMLAVAEDWGAVDEDVAHAGGVLVQPRAKAGPWGRANGVAWGVGGVV